jgi:predicted DNA-binding ribbon-helix-helix protein
MPARAFKDLRKLMRPRHDTSQAIRKRSVRIAGHATSVSLEPAFWLALEEIARARRLPLSGLLAQIDAERTAAAGNLSSALRVFVLACARAGELAARG